MSIETNFTSGSGNTYTIHQTGGEDNFNFTMTYGGFKSFTSFESDLKNGFVSHVPREETMESLMTNVLTDRSDYVNGIYQVTSNVSVEMVGDKYYQDAQAANDFLDSMVSHNAQISSPGHNDFGFDLQSMLTKSIMPIDMEDIQNRLSSITATPDNLKPTPSIGSITDLPIALQTCLANQMMIEQSTMMAQLTTLPKLTLEMSEAQTAATLAELEEENAEGEGGGILSTLSSMASSVFGGAMSPETSHSDSYCINGDILFDGMSDYINGGGISKELNM